jgi:transposase
MTPAERSAELEAVVNQQREQVATVLERVRESVARLTKDSHNRSKPPSSDGLARKTQSLRRRSGKKPGGQLGHRGETRRLVARPEVVAPRPAVCATCHAPHDDAPVLRRRQVYELPPLRLVVREESTAAPAAGTDGTTAPPHLREPHHLTWAHLCRTLASC